jgi:hypothetical protein
VEVIDLDSDKPVGKVEGMNRVHGIAVAPELGRRFITSGNSSTVKMFNLKTPSPERRERRARRPARVSRH